MTSVLFTQLLKSVAYLCALLLLGAFLRAVVPLFRKLFLPASVIGGFIGLLLGPIVMGDNAILKIPADYITNWSLLPGILIVPIFASVPLGMFMGQKKTQDKDPAAQINKKKKGNRYAAATILMACGLFTCTSQLQSIIGFSTNLLYKAFGGQADLYSTFGYELPSGFAGGHGTAGSVGKLFESYGFPYWETAQGITTTTATVGLIAGMIIGILMINIAARKGKTAVLQKPSDIPSFMAKGYIKDVKKQASLGRETTVNSSIETLTVHLGIMLVGCGIAYFIMDTLKATGMAAFQSLPVWFYALLVMFAINFILIKCKLEWLIDTKVKSKICGTMSDIAIVAAIASVPVKAVLAYIVPLMIMMVVGGIATFLWVFYLHDKFFKGYYSFEHAIICWGTAMGVMITGMMLLKICDPDYETPALTDFSVGFSTMSIISIFTGPFTYAALQTGTTLNNLTINAIIFIGYLVLALVGLYLFKKGKLAGHFVQREKEKIQDLEAEPAPAMD